MYYYMALIFIGSLIVGLLGMNRKMGFWGYFFGSLLLTPLIGLLLVLVSDKRQPMLTLEEYEKMKQKLQKKAELAAQKQARPVTRASTTAAEEGLEGADPGTAATNNEPLQNRA